MLKAAGQQSRRVLPTVHHGPAPLWAPEPSGPTTAQEGPSAGRATGSLRPWGSSQVRDSSQPLGNRSGPALSAAEASACPGPHSKRHPLPGLPPLPPRPVPWPPPWPLQHQACSGATGVQVERSHPLSLPVPPGVSPPTQPSSSQTPPAPLYHLKGASQGRLFSRRLAEAVEWVWGSMAPPCQPQLW